MAELLVLLLVLVVLAAHLVDVARRLVAWVAGRFGAGRYGKHHKVRRRRPRSRHRWRREHDWPGATDEFVDVLRDIRASLLEPEPEGRSP